MKTPLELSVVVPVFEEADSVELLHEELVEALRGVVTRYEVIFVDDGSRDRTPEKLRFLCARDPRVKMLRLRRNVGQSSAIQAGFDHATGRILVTLDGDLQNDPADIPTLLRTIEEGYGVVCGWRKDRKDRLFARRLPSVVANWLIGRLTGLRIHDNGCTLKAYRREVITKVSLYAELHRFLAPLLSLSGCRYREVPVNHRPRQFGRSKYGLSRAWRVSLDLLAVKMILRFGTHPAAWFAVLSFPFTLATIVAAAASLYLYAARTGEGSFPIIVPSVTALCAFAAVHLFLVGMLAELVVRMGEYRESESILAVVETKEPSS